jgi:hypothetical protein
MFLSYLNHDIGRRRYFASFCLSIEFMYTLGSKNGVPLQYVFCRWLWSVSSINSHFGVNHTKGSNGTSNTQSYIVSYPLQQRNTMNFIFLFSIPAMVGAFTIVPSKSASSKPQLHMIDKHIADMIDQELYRQNHKKEFEEAWMQKNKPAILQRMDDAVSASTIDALTSMDSDTVYNVRQQLRDQKLARTNPQQYCADRCIATGYCDVFEDLYVLSPDQ